MKTGDEDRVNLRGGKHNRRLSGNALQCLWGMEYKRANFKTFQFGQAQGGAEISTTGILSVFRGLKFSPNAEIGRNGAF